MNGVSDEDLQLLDAYLDDELSADEVEALRDRLIDESDLATALAELREGREARAAAFTSMEPGDLAVSDAISDIQSIVHVRDRWTRRVKEAVRYVAAAACVTLGVMIGSRANNNSNTGPQGASVAGMGGVSNVSRPVENTAQRQVQFLPGRIRPITPAATPRFVVLADESGRIVAAQEFRTADEAREFVEDLKRSLEGTGRTIVPFVPPTPQFSNSGPALTPSNSGPVVPAAAEEF